MPKKTLRIIIFTLLLLAGVYTFQLLKGSSKISIKDTEAKEYILVGLEFNGSANEQEFEDVFKKVQHGKEDKSAPTFMVNYEFEEPSKENDFHINAFIGYEMTDTTKKVSLPYEYRILHKRKVVRAASEAHFIFQNKIYPPLYEYAEKEKLQIDSTYIVEKYWKESKIEIEVGIQ